MEFDTQDTTKPKAITTGVALYPGHIRIVDELANREHRSFSNALQVIIDQWYGDHAEKIEQWSGDHAGKTAQAEA